jgi:hypothetical protein
LHVTLLPLLLLLPELTFEQPGQLKIAQSRRYAVQAACLQPSTLTNIVAGTYSLLLQQGTALARATWTKKMSRGKKTRAHSAPTSSMEDHSVSRKGFSPKPGVLSQTCNKHQQHQHQPDWHSEVDTNQSEIIPIELDCLHVFG